ncbi:MAG: O-antigen ligase family protein [Saprospiraceae bacterium]
MATYTNKLASNIFKEKPLVILPILLAVGIGGLIGLLDLKWALVATMLPLIALFFGKIILQPAFGLLTAMVAAFVALGISRYIPYPWGLSVDVILVIAWMGLLLHKILDRDWSPFFNDIVWWAVIWYGYLCLELINPEMPGVKAWGFAMRGIGFYQLLGFTLAFAFLRHPKYIKMVVNFILVLSVLGALWGLKQQYWGLDLAEEYWLWEEGHAKEHVLNGVLRVFSFYSDAGQFGASQAMVALMCAILFLGPFSWKHKILYLLTGLATLSGFLFSGTRGAGAVLLAGAVIYLLLSKNFKILVLGLAFLGLTFYGLRYTYAFHSFQPVARLRTALDVNNPSLQARLRNQETFSYYLASRPFGGGIGSSAYWGERFNPNSLLASTPTDSYFVRIWVETGLVGICLHLLMLGYFLGKGCGIVWHLKDGQLRYRAMALLAAFFGILVASYGNQVYSQFPTGIIMSIAIPLICMSPMFDQMIAKEKEER